MKTLRAAAAVTLLLATSAGAAPAMAQSAGFTAGQSSPPGAVRMAPLNPGGQWRTDFTDRRRGRQGGFNGGYWSDFERGPDQPRERCRKRGRCRGAGLFNPGYYGYGYGGITYDRLIAGGAYGYYTQETDRPAVEGGRAYFDYDRGYPYEYYSGPAPRLRMGEGRPERGSRECAPEWTRDQRTGRDVSVRVCRN